MASTSALFVSVVLGSEVALGSEDEAASVVDPDVVVVVVVVVVAAVDSAVAVFEAKRKAFNRDEMWVVQGHNRNICNDGSKSQSCELCRVAHPICNSVPTVVPFLLLLQPPVLRGERVEECLEGHELSEGVPPLANLPSQADNAVVQFLDRGALFHSSGCLLVSP